MSEKVLFYRMWWCESYEGFCCFLLFPLLHDASASSSAPAVVMTWDELIPLRLLHWLQCVTIHPSFMHVSSSFPLFLIALRPSACNLLSNVLFPQTIVSFSFAIPYKVEMGYTLLWQAFCWWTIESRTSHIALWYLDTKVSFPVLIIMIVINCCRLGVHFNVVWRRIYSLHSLTLFLTVQVSPSSHWPLLTNVYWQIDLRLPLSLQATKSRFSMCYFTSSVYMLLLLTVLSLPPRRPNAFRSERLDANILPRHGEIHQRINYGQVRSEHSHFPSHSHLLLLRQSNEREHASLTRTVREDFLCYKKRGGK